MILYLEDFALFPEQTFRITASVDGEGLEIELIEWMLPKGAVPVTKLLGDNEYARIVAQAWELAKAYEPDEMDIARDELIRRDEA